MIAAARVAAFDILTAVSSSDIDLASAIDRGRARLGEARDRALATEIALGVQRARGTLDYLIGHFSNRAIDQLDPEVLQILRLSAYQLLHLTRVPASAIVDDAVKLSRHVRKASASGLVNAVLRALSRARRQLPLPTRPADRSDREQMIAYLSVTLSHPRWLVERWLDRLGFERTEAWLAFNNGAAPLTLRANTLRTTAPLLRTKLEAIGIATTPGRYAPHALLVERGQDLGALPSLASEFVAQDEASQLVPLLAGPAPGRRVLDACASPGGKTIAMAAAMPPSGLIVACDLRERRMRLLRQTVAVAGAEQVRLVRVDFRSPPPFKPSFDCVLVDAPCSGLGVLRREPDIKWRRQAAHLQDFADRQLQMLQRAAEVVAPGGRLVYATCSSESIENEDVARRFAAGRPGFRHVDAGTCHPSLPPEVVDDSGDLRTTPDQHGLEAFFGTVFQRL